MEEYMKKLSYCPICGTQHDIEYIEKSVICKIKNEEVECLQKYYVCREMGEEIEFESGKMANENLLAIKDAYRKKKGLLTSSEIKAIREKYHFTQAELATILDWGEVTITRYETKQIQDDAHDDILRMIADDPKKVYDYLLHHFFNFEESRFDELKKLLLDIISTEGRRNSKRKVLEETYIMQNEPSLNNGNKTLDIDKTVDMVSYFALYIPGLTQVKLMKLLWYADMLSFKNFNHSISGLVYLHEQFGALPHGYKELLSLDEIGTVEEYSPQYDNITVTIVSNKKLSDIFFDSQEKNILDVVISKFKTYSAKQISEYMHQEIAYQKTSKNQIISFGFASQLKPF